jgi:predicted O-methyltransferase YrrM
LFDPDIVRRWWRRRAKFKAQRAAFLRLQPAPFHPSKLGRITLGEIAECLHSEAIDAEWQEVSQSIDDIVFMRETKTGAVNIGDRRALYHLVRALDATHALEIGTNVGASTLHIAAALQRNKGRLVTVDVADVNDSPTAPWKVARLARAPRDSAAMLGMSDRVSFVTAPSLDYLRQCNETFDFVFLDGEHAAAAVYQDIAGASRCLRGGALIVLHDFFPNRRPLWSDRKVIPGPFLAVERLRSEAPGIDVLPLGALPWPTKQGSRVTSLAVLSRA